LPTPPDASITATVGIAITSTSWMITVSSSVKIVSGPPAMGVTAPPATPATTLPRSDEPLASLAHTLRLPITNDCTNRMTYSARPAENENLR
jgi:hypothetical protein